MKLSVIVPVFNERLYIEEVFRRICRATLPNQKDLDLPANPSGEQTKPQANHMISSMEIVVVDDCSTDGTRELLRSIHQDFQELFGNKAVIPTEMRYFEQLENQGKGAAVRAGIDQSTGDVVIVQDADLEYDPKDYSRLIAPILDGRADAVFGSRFLGETRRVFLFWHAVVNWFLTTISNMLTDLCLTDMETGYKAVRGDLIRAIRLTSNRFGFEPEVVARLSRTGARIYEVPISYKGRGYDEGKKIGAADGVAAFWHIVHFTVFGGSPLKKGAPQPLISLQKFSKNTQEKQLIEAFFKNFYGDSRQLDILEIGAGIGNLTQTLIRRGHVTALDSNPNYIKHLNRRFHFLSDFHTEIWDTENQAQMPSILKEKKFDLIVAFHVLERLRNDTEVLQQWMRFLKPGGNLLVLVPNNQRWYSSSDRAVGRVKRYSKKELQTSLTQGGLECESMQYVNFFGIFSWIFSTKILQRESKLIPKPQSWLSKLIASFLRPFEGLFCKFSGLNLLAVARKPVDEN